MQRNTHTCIVKQEMRQGQGASDRWDASISRVSRSFTISDKTWEEWPLLPFGVWFTPLSPLTRNLSLSHLSFSSTVIFPSLWPNYFCLCSAPPALPLQLSLYIYYNFPSSFHIISFMLSYRLVHMLLSLWNVFYPLPSLVCFCHHQVQLPSGCSLSLRNPKCRQTDKLQLHLIINVVVESRGTGGR